MKFSHSDIGLTGIILGVGPANGRRRNGVPIGRAHTKCDPYVGVSLYHGPL